MRRALLLSCLALGGCPSLPSEPPPPLRKAELVPAPPNARGARAAGTDAAPKPELGLPLGEDAAPAVPPTEAAPDAGPDAPPTPDAGMAL